MEVIQLFCDFSESYQNVTVNYHGTFQGGYSIGHPGAGGQDPKLDLQNRIATMYMTTDMKCAHALGNKETYRVEQALYAAIDKLR